MEWRVCPRFPEYEVSEYGQLRRCVPVKGGVVGRILKGHVRKEDGYLAYVIRREGTKRSYHHPKAHQLVLEAFVGPKPFPKAEGRHKDGLRILDHWSNLEWGTRVDNAVDRVRDGRGTSWWHSTTRKRDKLGRYVRDKAKLGTM